ncbi:MAG: HDIG domain-containing protein, partial [Eubacteriales bacterium]|nr:HDIG domain-containing protein [Eubacteriales bacterium]
MEQKEQFVTHRREDGSYQLLKEHLEGVARLAEQFARALGTPKEGWRTGLLHDIGKYSRKGQRRQRDPE